MRRVSVATLVEDLSASLEAGHLQSEQALRRSGLDTVVDQIKTLDGVQAFDIEAEELLREVYRRAEAAEAGQGERVLAHLYGSAAQQFPAVAEDPAFARLREVLDNTDPAHLDPARFRFVAQVSAKDFPLPPILDKAVRELAYVHAGGNLSELSRLASRAFGKEGFSLSRYLASADSVEDALRMAFARHIPPPRPEQVARDLMAATAEHPAVMERASFMQALGDLDDSLLDGADGDSAVHRKLAEMQDELPSRVAQLEEARSADLPGSVDRQTAASLKASLQHSVATAQTSRQLSGALARSAQEYTNYVSASFEVLSTGLQAGAAGGSGGRTYKTTTAPAHYAARAAAEGSSRVARAYRVAVRSSRAARGVAAGAPLGKPENVRLLNAAWLAEEKDDRLGRIVVQVQDNADQMPVLAVSRLLFADSVLAAADVLWGGHAGATAYRDGEILVLMSMDPFAVADEQMAAMLEEMGEGLQTRVNVLQVARKRLEEEPQNEELAEAIARFSEELESDIALFVLGRESMPRKVVTHPALFGRELAWSLTRVDFWLNDRAGLSEEAARSNGGQPMPAHLLNLQLDDVATWQYYEREGAIRLDSVPGKLRRLRVQSAADDAQLGRRSHYAVSMFGGEESVEGELDRLPELERQLQDMLDWLAVNHHDFIRLNDFSEAFSLLRWVHGAGIDFDIVDMDGAAPLIATPDRTTRDARPQVGG